MWVRERKRCRRYNRGVLIPQDDGQWDGQRGKGAGKGPRDQLAQTGCADARRALRSTAGLCALPLAPAPRCATPASTVLARPLRDDGTVRLRVMRGEPFPCALAPAPPVPGTRGWRSMMRQPSGPSPSLTLTLASGLMGGVRERVGVGGSAGGGGVSSMNQSWCSMRNSSTS